MINALSKRLDNNKGFTLIELVVVIAILAVLVGIAAPNIIRYVKDSREKTDISNAAILANGMLRAVAEGYTIQDTDGEIKSISDKSNKILLKPDGTTEEDLVPRFVQSFPKVKKSGYTLFGYSYNETTEELKIYRLKDEEDTTGEPLYPAPDADKT